MVGPNEPHSPQRSLILPKKLLSSHDGPGFMFGSENQSLGLSRAPTQAQTSRIRPAFAPHATSTLSPREKSDGIC